MWFEQLTGFKEQSPSQVYANLEVNGNALISKINNRSMIYGHLEIATLADLRAQVQTIHSSPDPLTIHEIVGDAKKLHTDASNTGALFQVASQFNLLEMPCQDVSPGDGISRYDSDHTQGPACAVAAGAGTIFRNYFVEINGQIGQTADRQIDCLKGMGDLLGNNDDRLWKMQNGYALATKSGLEEITERIKTMSEDQLDNLRQALRIGIQWDTQVTLDGCEHLVTQAYCSALPVGYSALPLKLWREFATLVLEATYEATLCAAVINFVRTGNNKVYLTLVGGGVFGNDVDWIVAAIRRAVSLFPDSGLDVAIVSYGGSNRDIQALFETSSAGPS